MLRGSTISSSDALLESLEFSTVIILSSAFFSNCMPFIPASCFIALARSSKTMLHRSSESGHPCLVLGLGWKHSVSYHYVWCYLEVSHRLPLSGWGSFQSCMDVLLVLKGVRRSKLLFSSEHFCIWLWRLELWQSSVTMRRAGLRSKGIALMMDEWRDRKSQGPFCHWFTEWTSPGSSPTNRIPIM